MNKLIKIYVYIVLLICIDNANSATIYLCKNYSGGLFWSSANCSSKNSLIERIVTVPDNLPFQTQVNIGEQVALEAKQILNKSNVSQYNNENTIPQNNKIYCNDLEQQIIAIDNQARLPQYGEIQNNLRESRRKIRDLQYRNNCKQYRK